MLFVWDEVAQNKLSKQVLTSADVSFVLYLTNNLKINRLPNNIVQMIVFFDLASHFFLKVAWNIFIDRLNGIWHTDLLTMRGN